jgi:phage FluMu gp28-like protein
MKNNILDIFLPYQKKFFLNKKKRKIFIASRQIGKSFVAAGLLTYKALAKQNGTSLCVSVNQLSASEIIKKCKIFAEAIKVLSNGKITYSASFDKIVFSNGSRVISLSSNPDSLRGFSAACVVVDEAAFAPNLDDIIQSIAPTLTRDKDAELILLTTPAGKNGTFYEMYKTAIKSDEWYVQTTTIYAAKKDGLIVDIENLRSLCLNDAVFRQEYCCEFANSNISLIDTSKIQTYEQLPNITDYFIGVDIGRTNDKTAIVVVGRDSSNLLYLVDITSLENTEFAKQLEIIKNKFNQYSPRLLLGDANGIGMSTMEELNLRFNKKCKPFNFSQTSKNDCYEYFVKVVLNSEFFCKKQYLSDLIIDCQNVTKVISDNGKVSYQAKHTDAGHSDILSALVLALKASRDNQFIRQLPQTFKFNSRFS